MKNNSGFTIIELLAVIAVIAILLTIGVVSGRQMIGKARVEQEVRRLYADLQTARTSAMNRSRTQFLIVDAAQRRYDIWEDTDPGPFGNDNWSALDSRLLRTPVENQIAFVPGPGPANIGFDPRGVASQNATIRIGDGSMNPRVDCVTISATRIRIGLFTGGACAS